MLLFLARVEPSSKAYNKALEVNAPGPCMSQASDVFGANPNSKASTAASNRSNPKPEDSELLKTTAPGFSSTAESSNSFREGITH